jgi:predicted DNA-binding transcriptional regulator YafY
MRADRLLSVLLLLQAHGRMSALALAERLEVSRRTVYRDLDALGMAGVPIVVERGARGGASLMEGYRTDLTGLTEAEVEALLGLASTSAAGHLGVRPDLESATRKLSATRPGQSGLRLQQRVLIDGEHWWAGTAAPAHLGRIQDAVLSDRRLRLRYRRGEETVVVREVDPYGLVLKSGVWYLLAGRDGETRTYRISRVEDAWVLDAPCRRPPGFDLERAWEASVRGFQDRAEVTEVTVRLTPGAAGVFLRVASEHLRGSLEGGVATLVFPSEGAAAALLAGHVGEVEVLSPDGVRRRLLEIGERLTVTYAAPGP